MTLANREPARVVKAIRDRVTETAWAIAGGRQPEGLRQAPDLHSVTAGEYRAIYALRAQQTPRPSCRLVVCRVEHRATVYQFLDRIKRPPP